MAESLHAGFLHVAAAVILDGAGHILLARRPEHLHQGGLWEFPGGKVEPGESAMQALRRELEEELGISVTRARPLIRIPHAYPDRKVLLDVWRVDGFTGEAHGREGQPLRWIAPEELGAFAFPAANRPIVTAARLPDTYLITPDPGGVGEWAVFMSQLNRALEGGIALVQFRAHSLSDAEYVRHAREVRAACAVHGARMLVNRSPEVMEAVEAHGLHLPSRLLMAARARAIAADRLLSASCHDLEEVKHAGTIGCDFAVVSPVEPTRSHPGAATLGWCGLRALTEQSSIPIFALGGMTPGDLEQVWNQGAQGIAAISSLWGADA